MRAYLIFFVAVIAFYNDNSAEAHRKIEANPAAKQLYDDLLSNYNKQIRPVENISEVVKVWMSVKLVQLIEVNLRSQVITASIWVMQKWFDSKLTWNPPEYGGLEEIYVPSELIWLPDIVLFNNADGNFEVTLMTRATLRYTGQVYWAPPAIYRSYCEMNVLYFPFDEQCCFLKFGSWTYNESQVYLNHMQQPSDSDLVEYGIDLSEFVKNVEWDLLEVPAYRNSEYIDYLQESYTDVTFTMVMRRKILFYIVNLIIPMVGITFLTVLVFYLPSDSNEKVTLCTSILVSLTVFFLLLAEIIPPTSLAVPLLGKYLLFTMALVTCSIIVTVGVLNVHHRSPTTHELSPRVRRIFLDVLPKYLGMRRPDYSPDYLYDYNNEANNGNEEVTSFRIPPPPPPPAPRRRFSERPSQLNMENELPLPPPAFQNNKNNASPTETETTNEDETPCKVEKKTQPKRMSQELREALLGVQFIAQQMKNEDKDDEISEDWKYIAMVFDRFFLYVFLVACIVGTVWILCMAPSLFDNRPAVDILSKYHAPIDVETLKKLRNYTMFRPTEPAPVVSAGLSAINGTA